MESLGEKLKATREEKSLSVDQVARDTNIAKRYILALEEEAFSDFPGEPYLIGFLRNYSDYLGLDAEEVVGLYKNFKIQEQPVPMEELLERKRHKSGGARIAVIIAAVVAVAVLVYLLLPLLSAGRGPRGVAVGGKTAVGAQYTLKDEIVERSFHSGDTVILPIGGKDYPVKLVVADSNTLLLVYPSGQTSLKLGEEKPLYLSGGSVPDVKVYLRDIDFRDPAKTVVVRFDRFTESPQAPQTAQGQPAAGATTATPTGGQGGGAQGSAAQAASPQTAAAGGQTAGAQAAGGGAAASNVPAAASAGSAGSDAGQPAAGGAGTTPGGSGTGAASAPVAAQPQAVQPASQAPSAISPSVEVAVPAAAAPTPAAPGAATGAGGQTAPAQHQGTAGQQGQPQGVAPQAGPHAALAVGPTSRGEDSILPVDPVPEVLARAASASPFTVTLSFSATCHVRYQIDGQSQDQHLFNRGETARLDVGSGVDLWASNAGAVTAQVDGRQISLGAPGEATAQRLTWVKNGSTGDFQLQLLSLD